MPRDLKPTTNPASGSSKSGSMPPMLMGILIGLLLGILLAIGIAVWLNRANNPFFEKSRPVDALPTISARPTLPPMVKNEKGDAEKPRFEFYQILPGDKSGSGNATNAAGVPKPLPSPDAKPTVKSENTAAREPPKPASGETVFLQAGAFQNQTDAENLKAKIAFAGFEANVRPVNLPDKGTLYRVRLGPYKSVDEVNRIKATLSQNGIASTVMKPAD